MSIEIKTAEQIACMRVAGELAAQVLTMVEPHVRPGMTTDALNTLCHDYMVDVQKVTPAPLMYKGFPKSICTSVNHVVCHGIPSDRVLKKGDVINIDVTVKTPEGYHGDTSKMFLVGKVSPSAARLCRVTQECLYLGIQAVRPGGHVGDIGAAIQAHAHAHQYSIVREYCGHGIGQVFHDAPSILHYGRCGEGATLLPGMTFTIEPMLNAGKRHVKELNDGWTVITKDRQLSAQWEHTVLVTESGCEILTLRQEESIAREQHAVVS